MPARITLIGALFAALAAVPAAAQTKEDPLVARGRYLMKTAGCNDCHTPGYMEKGGQVPESEWLKGDKLAWNGPWGTTFAPNLRLYFEAMSEEEWLRKAKNLSTRPPMPWFNVRAMTTTDQRAIYRYARTLKPSGEPAPAYLPPDQTPPKPAMVFQLPGK
ncbi:MAG TPA: cytochrome C [Burkholderiales bacterium]|nr:cytochrome C [Burkholderiales bacterium]